MKTAGSLRTFPVASTERISEWMAGWDSISQIVFPASPVYRVVMVCNNGQPARNSRGLSPQGIIPFSGECKIMKIQTLPVLLCSLLVTTVVFADELHNKAMAATHDLQQAITEMRIIHQEHGNEFGGHLARAVSLAEQAEQERNAALEYYRARHPGWQ
jgi:hypothetical protein